MNFSSDIIMLMPKSSPWSLARTYMFLLAFIPLLTGCLVVSTHSKRQVQVRVTERATANPVRDADVKVLYGYESGGVFFILRVPEDASAKTDAQGLAVLPMADFEQTINLKVNEETYPLTKKLIAKGGFPEGGAPAGGTGNYVVQLTPVRWSRESSVRK